MRHLKELSVIKLIIGWTWCTNEITRHENVQMKRKFSRSNEFIFCVICRQKKNTKTTPNTRYGKCTFPTPIHYTHPQTAHRAITPRRDAYCNCHTTASCSTQTTAYVPGNIMVHLSRACTARGIPRVMSGTNGVYARRGGICLLNKFACIYV